MQRPSLKCSKCARTLEVPGPSPASSYRHEYALACPGCGEKHDVVEVAVFSRARNEAALAEWTVRLRQTQTPP